MKSPWRKAWMLALAPFLMAACAAPDTAEDTETAAEEAAPAPETTPTPPPAMEETATHMAQVTALNESGTTGQVEIRALGEGSELRVTLMGATEGAHQGMIHTGTCDAPGEVVAQLQPVTVDATGQGEATSEVTQPLTSVMDGNHIVVYHEAGGEPGQPVACASIPAQMQQPM